MLWHSFQINHTWQLGIIASHLPPKFYWKSVFFFSISTSRGKPTFSNCKTTNIWTNNSGHPMGFENPHFWRFIHLNHFFSALCIGDIDVKSSANQLNKSSTTNFRSKDGEDSSYVTKHAITHLLLGAARTI